MLELLRCVLALFALCLVLEGVCAAEYHPGDIVRLSKRSQHGNVSIVALVACCVGTID